jgi:outer membrane receptor protein involved in Fe transport
VGLILTPRWVPGFRLSLDYLEQVRNDAIISLFDPQEAVSEEISIPGRVRRGAPDGHASGIGPIEFVDLRSVNVGEVSSRSLDISLTQTVDGVGPGRMVFSLLASKNISFKLLGVEKVRNNSGFSFDQRQLKWNGNAQIRWEGPQWGFGWSTRYLDHLLVTVHPFLPDYSILQGGDRAPQAFNHDLNISYRAPATQNPLGAQWLLSGTAFTFGVKNVFDRAPRFWTQGGATRGIAPYDSDIVRGRTVWFRASKDFQ